MIQDLEHLVKLQGIDLRIKEQELAKEQYPAAVADLKKRIAQAEAAKNAAALRLEQLTGGIKDMDDQTAKLRDSLAKSEERLSSIQTNKEYDAVHREIETQKSMLASSVGRKDNLEMDIERHKNALAEAEKALESVIAELQPQIDDLNAKIGAIDSVIAEITKERNEVSPLISNATSRTYDSIRKKCKTGKAVSLVNESKKCTVCNMVLRPQLFNEIRRGSNFKICESCGSMLIWDVAAAPVQ
ncbi:MAG: C4-type zinc ribbon domain-containing protein [Chitinispirillia bacterium]|nr:C4-type zinc ribbon domain-containing protein [Chitinispirillia bacterium]MCL2242160.1 C4-type zinc ribbon domain-containing protein [Chitinispirillia bacterium]